MDPAANTTRDTTSGSSPRPVSTTVDMGEPLPLETSGRSASIDDSPPTSSTSSPTSSTSPHHPWSMDPPSHTFAQPSLFNHPLESSASLPHPHALFAANFRQESYTTPMTPGEEMVFDRGLLFASRPRPSARSDLASSVLSAPLPALPSMVRSYSDPEAGTDPMDGQREIKSTPIILPNLHVGSTSPSPSSHSQFPSRSPSPNLSTHTLTSQRSPNLLPPTTNMGLSPHASNASLNHAFNREGGQGPYSIYSPPAALRPDSVCSFPDSSPVMAPNVLAAVDARLRESSKSRAQNNGSPKPRPPPGSASGSNASSIAPVKTHLSVLQTSEAITSREQLYDILNREDDNESLGIPQPGFIHSSRAGSTRSSRRTSGSSSLNQSAIELNAKRSSASLVRSPPAATKTERSRHRELASAAMVTKEGKEEIPPVLQSAFEKSAWLTSKTRTSRKWRGLCCAVGILAFLGAVAGIVVGFVSRTGKIDGLAPPPGPDDSKDKPLPPITDFTPDPNLRKAFYGVDYNPAKALMPWCGVTLQNVVDDIILMSQITNRVRLYGMDCGQADLTFQAIKALNLKMQVVLTIWVDKDAVTYQRQYDTLFKVLDTHGTDLVAGISVGNEVLFRKDKTLAELGQLMASVRSAIKTKYSKSIPIFTSEIGNNLNSSLADVSDELQGNLHPFFSDTPADKAANWTMQQYETLIGENPTKAGLKGAISEVGWPSAPASSPYKTYAIPGIANLQTLLDTFVCQANAAGIPYYWFEFRDEPWKHDPAVPVEAYWGLFDKDSKLKVQIPNCIAP